MVTLSPTRRLRSPEARPDCCQTCPLSRCSTIASGQRSRLTTRAVKREGAALRKIFQDGAWWAAAASRLLVSDASGLAFGLGCACSEDSCLNAAPAGAEADERPGPTGAGVGE